MSHTSHSEGSGSGSSSFSTKMVLVSLYVLVSLVVSIMGFYVLIRHFWEHRRMASLQHRMPELIVISSMILCIQLGNSWFDLANGIIMRTSINTEMWVIPRCVCIAWLAGVVTLTYLRFHWNYCRARYQAKKTWRNELEMSVSRPWILKAHICFVTPKHTLFVCLSWTLLCGVVIPSLLLQTAGVKTISMIVNSGLSLLLLSALLWTFLKTRAVQDRFMMVRDLKYTSMSVVLWINFSAALFISPFLRGRFTYRFLTHIGDFLTFALYFVLNMGLPLLRIQTETRSRRTSSVSDPTLGADGLPTPMRRLSKRTSTSEHTVTSPMNSGQRLTQTLRDYDSFVLLTEHCVSEMSVEGILFIVWYMRAKQLLFAFLRDRDMFDFAAVVTTAEREATNQQHSPKPGRSSPVPIDFAIGSPMTRPLSSSVFGTAITPAAVPSSIRQRLSGKLHRREEDSDSDKDRPDFGMSDSVAATATNAAAFAAASSSKPSYRALSAPMSVNLLQSVVHGSVERRPQLFDKSSTSFALSMTKAGFLTDTESMIRTFQIGHGARPSGFKSSAFKTGAMLTAQAGTSGASSGNNSRRRSTKKMVSEWFNLKALVPLPDVNPALKSAATNSSGEIAVDGDNTADAESMGVLPEQLPGFAFPTSSAEGLMTESMTDHRAPDFLDNPLAIVHLAPSSSPESNGKQGEELDRRVPESLLSDKPPVLARNTISGDMTDVIIGLEPEDCDPLPLPISDATLGVEMERFATHSCDQPSESGLVVIDYNADSDSTSSEREEVVMHEEGQELVEEHAAGITPSSVAHGASEPDETKVTLGMLSLFASKSGDESSPGKKDDLAGVVPVTPTPVLFQNGSNLMLGPLSCTATATTMTSPKYRYCKELGTVIELPEKVMNNPHPSQSNRRMRMDIEEGSLEQVMSALCSLLCRFVSDKGLHCVNVSADVRKSAMKYHHRLLMFCDEGRTETDDVIQSVTDNYSLNRKLLMIFRCLVSLDRVLTEVMRVLRNNSFQRFTSAHQMYLDGP